jgi:hypothetical protein
MRHHGAAELPRLSLRDLSPTTIIPQGHLLVVVKGYFDGGNQADSRQYDRITLATVCGTCEQWEAFESEWSKSVTSHGASFLHTTNAVCLQREFSKNKGWDDDKVNALIDDCVSVVERHLCIPTEGQVPLGLPFSRNIVKEGLMPVTLSVPLADYKKARAVIPHLPNSVNEICTTESLGFCFKWGIKIGAEAYQLYFDQGEPFFGHACDRRNHRKAKKDIAPMKKVVHIGESDMRTVPALQMADLFAWCINHNDDVRRAWHARLNGLPWGSTILSYEYLVNPTPGALERTAAWNLPRRRPNR